jgi:outer membrane protein OmpA-like peptidoglycan-associated protein
VKNAMLFTLLVLAILPGSAAAQQKDAVGCTDNPLFTRMPTYWIHHCTAKEFDAKTMPAGEGKTTVEGRTWEAAYYPQATAKERPSELQILRNFEQAVSKLGGTVQATSKSRRTFKIAKDGKEFWVELWAEFTGKYGLTIVEKAAMQQDVVASAEVFSSDLKNTGRAIVEGIYFDTGKSEIKPESAQAIGEVAKLLAADATLKLYVVGHTDNVGTVESNLRLSQERAEAVVQALVRTHKIAAARLRSFGSGPYSPIASNDAEAGRAKNRRVELVKQ